MSARVLAFLLIAAACTATEAAPPAEPTDRFAVELVGRYSEPVDLAEGPDGILYVVERMGRIRRVSDGSIWLDIREQLGEPYLSEAGLLGLLFDPDGFVWTYAAHNQNGNSWLTRWTLDSRGRPSDPVVIAEWGRALWHHGGHMEWVDGRLWIGIGDGAGEPEVSVAQDPASLRGAILAVDPTSDEIETMAYGLRNPWRWTIDDGWLYVADVGHGMWEEITAVPLDGNVHNFGYPLFEADSCLTEVCNQDGLVFPQISYSHGTGCAAVVGGYVYRGDEIWWLKGWFLYSDFCLGGLRGARFVNGEVTETHEWLTLFDGQVLSFGRDRRGELYVLTLDGSVVRIVAG